jgi:hypothetical protein
MYGKKINPLIKANTKELHEAAAQSDRGGGFFFCLLASLSCFCRLDSASLWTPPVSAGV